MGMLDLLIINRKKATVFDLKETTASACVKPSMGVIEGGESEDGVFFLFVEELGIIVITFSHHVKILGLGELVGIESNFCFVKCFFGDGEVLVQFFRSDGGVHEGAILLLLFNDF